MTPGKDRVTIREQAGSKEKEKQFVKVQISFDSDSP